MTDTKWRSPTRHSIANHITDKLPPKGEARDDVQNALNKWDNQGEINHEELCLFIEYTRRALAQRQTDVELLSVLREVLEFDDKTDALSTAIEFKVRKAIARAEQKGGE